MYIFVKGENTFFQTTSVSTHYVFDGPMLKKTVLLHYVLPLRYFWEIILESLLSTNSTVKVTCQVGLFLSEKKSSWIFFPQKNQSVSIGLIFIPKIVVSGVYRPQILKKLVPAPVIYLDGGVLHYTLSRLLGSPDPRVASSVWTGKCPSCLVVAMRSRRGDGFTHRKWEKPPFSRGEMCFSTMAWHEGLCFNHW